MSSKTGTLYVVATPIGNMADLSLRAQHTLTKVNCIAAEDTRHSKALMFHYGITTPLTALHEHNEIRVTPRLINRLLAGYDIALISDAGTPLISDPGYRLISSAHDRQIIVSPIPGACALIAAMSVCGLATDRFAFEGFLPAKESARRTRLANIATDSRTLVFYEAPQRLSGCLEDMVAVLGADRNACIAREISKRFETIKRGLLGRLHKWVEADSDQQRGEIVIIVNGFEESDTGSTHEDVALMRVLLTKLSIKDAAVIAATLSEGSKNHFYQLGLEIKA